MHQAQSVKDLPEAEALVHSSSYFTRAEQIISFYIIVKPGIVKTQYFILFNNLQFKCTARLQ